MKTRSPNLYERYTWSTWMMAANMNNTYGDGNGYVGNVSLKPETAHTLSFSSDWHDETKKYWSFKSTPYFTYVDDFSDMPSEGFVDQSRSFHHGHHNRMNQKGE